jgi:uncharacterized protein YecT (DUF1311 family)
MKKALSMSTVNHDTAERLSFRPKAYVCAVDAAHESKHEQHLVECWVDLKRDETSGGGWSAGLPLLTERTAKLDRAPFPRTGLFAFAIFTAFLALAGTKELDAQSFNCRYAHHRDEKLICRNPGLAKLDEELASVYRRLILRLSRGEGEQLDREEEAFVIARRKCGAQRACIDQKYRDRIRELESALANYE